MRNLPAAMQAWKKILRRDPRVLEWNDMTSYERLLGFDFSSNSFERRDNQCENIRFKINKYRNRITLQLDDLKYRLPVLHNELYEHLMLKLLLNTHSLIVMGRQCRYDGNLMVYVKPSCKKLIDRAARYVMQLADKNISREEAIKHIIEQQPSLKDGESIVLKVLEKIK